MASPTGELRTAIGQSSYVSIGLVSALIIAALFYGRQLQRLDAIEEELREVRVELREFRREIARFTNTTGR